MVATVSQLTMKNVMCIVITMFLAALLLAQPVHPAQGHAPEAPAAGQFRLQQATYKSL